MLISNRCCSTLTSLIVKILMKVRKKTFLQHRKTSLKRQSARSPYGSEWGSSDEEPLVSLQCDRTVRTSTNRPLRWDRMRNFENPSSNFYVDPPLDEPRASAKPSYKYFCQYIKPDFFEHISQCTNISTIHRTGRSLNSNPEEMRSFIGVSIAMGILGLP
jgi:hypothetical protein